MKNSLVKITETRRLQCLEFIEHYLTCFNATEAARRMGYTGTSASTQGHELLHLKFTLKELKNRFDQHAIENKHARQLVIEMLFQSATDFENGTPASRVTAQAHLSRIFGLDRIRIDAEVSHTGGVMTVPMAQSIEEWEKLAKASQSSLMADAVNI